MQRIYRHIIIYLILALLAFQLFHKMGYALYFILNRAVVAKTHCVNKARKEVRCNGRCHLKKYLAQDLKLEKEQDSSPLEHSIDWSESEQKTLYCSAQEAALQFPFYFYFAEYSASYPKAILNKAFKLVKLLLRPPIA